jgi:hypothetical protein
MGAIWNEMQGFVGQKSDTLMPFYQDMSAYFSWVKEEAEAARAKVGKPKGYDRRPPIGLRLQLEGNKVLAIRPGWRSPGRYSRLDGVEYDLARHFPGDIVPGVVTLELLGPGKLLSLKLTTDKVQLVGSVSLDMNENKERLHMIVKAAHSIMMRPWETFEESAGLADRCCCCRKLLTDLTSRSRGIGPECITKFKYFSEPSPVVKRYRRQYRNIDDPWEIVGDCQHE